jgi:hypothetical protein
MIEEHWAHRIEWDGVVNRDQIWAIEAALRSMVAEFPGLITNTRILHQGALLTCLVDGNYNPKTLKRITRAVSELGHDEALAPGNVRIIADRIP